MAVESFTGRKRVRKTFGRIPTVVPMPNLIEVQKTSYESFLQRETRSEEREKEEHEIEPLTQVEMMEINLLQQSNFQDTLIIMLSLIHI